VKEKGVKGVKGVKSVKSVKSVNGWVAASVFKQAMVLSGRAGHARLLLSFPRKRESSFLDCGLLLV